MRTFPVSVHGHLIFSLVICCVLIVAVAVFTAIVLCMPNRNFRHIIDTLLLDWTPILVYNYTEKV